MTPIGTDLPPLRIGGWFQGPRGSGQGGWTAQRLSAAIGEPVTIAIKAPIPLETDLEIVRVGDAWHLVAPADTSLPILIATRREAGFVETAPVSVADARAAGANFPLHGDHPVPVCFSCGQEPDSMQVQSGPLHDGRWATDWTVPDWAVNNAGRVDEGALWAAIDCAQGWYAGMADVRRHAVTVQIAVEIRQPLTPRSTYAIVAWEGDYQRPWDGRKRGGAGALFDAAGDCVAVSRSFWVEVPRVE